MFGAGKKVSGIQQPAIEMTYCGYPGEIMAAIMVLYGTGLRTQVHTVKKCLSAPHADQSSCQLYLYSSIEVCELC